MHMLSRNSAVLFSAGSEPDKILHFSSEYSDKYNLALARYLHVLETEGWVIIHDYKLLADLNGDSIHARSY